MRFSCFSSALSKLSPLGQVRNWMGDYLRQFKFHTNWSTFLTVRDFSGNMIKFCTDFSPPTLLEEEKGDSTDAPVASTPVSSPLPTASSGLDLHTIASTKALNFRY